MAATFKSFLNNDVTTTRTLLHEAIPITGSIVSGTYNDNSVKLTGSNAEFNIKNLTPNSEIDAGIFKWNSNKYPDVEEIDNR